MQQPCHAGAGGVIAGPGLALGCEPAQADQFADVADGLLLGQVGVGLVDGPAYLRAPKGRQQCVDHALVQPVALGGFAEVDPGTGEQIGTALGLLRLAVCDTVGPVPGLARANVLRPGQGRQAAAILYRGSLQAVQPVEGRSDVCDRAAFGGGLGREYRVLLHHVPAAVTGCLQDVDQGG